MTDQPEDHVWTMARKQRIAMLTTEEEGKLVSRPMATLARPEENRIYFVTRVDAKVGEIGGSAAVNLAFSDAHNNSYLSISATARTSQDREKLKELWSVSTRHGCLKAPRRRTSRSSLSSRKRRSSGIRPAARSFMLARF